MYNTNYCLYFVRGSYNKLEANRLKRQFGESTAPPHFLSMKNLERVEDRMPSEPSGGMKKHVALARSIIFDETKEVIQSEVLLYDEPTAGHNPSCFGCFCSQQDALRQTGKIASYVVVTHQDSTISRAVDRLLFLYEGRIVWEGMAHGFSSTKKILLFDSLHQVAWMVQSNTGAVKIFSWFDDDFLGLPGISFVNKRIQFCRPSIGVGLAGN